MLKEDLSGMWLSNRTVMIPAGSQIRVVFSNSQESPVSDQEYGNLVRLEVSGPKTSRVIEFYPGMDFEDLLTQEVLRRFQTGEKAVKETADGHEVTYKSGVNYWVPLHWVVCDTYLDLREKFEPHVSDAPVPKPTVGYYLQVFSDFDRNLAQGIRNVIWKLSEEGLVVPIRMVPERYLGTASKGIDRA